MNAFFNKTNWLVFLGGGLILTFAMGFLAFDDYQVPSSDELNKLTFRGPATVYEHAIDIKGAHIKSSYFSIPEGPTVYYDQGSPNYDRLSEFLSTKGNVTVSLFQRGQSFLFALDVDDVPQITYDEVVAAKRKKVGFELSLAGAGAFLALLMLVSRRKFLTGELRDAPLNS